jgi:diphthamide biosynthesis methyltransferase
MNNVKKLPTAQVEQLDLHGVHADNLHSAARYAEALRNEVTDMHAKILDLEKENDMLVTQVQCFRIQLEAERKERRHYHQFSTSITTSLSNVTKIIDDVLAQAVGAARSEDKGEPDIVMPDGLQKFLNRPHEANGKDAA